jgi:hypothetical protein
MGLSVAVRRREIRRALTDSRRPGHRANRQGRNHGEMREHHPAAELPITDLHPLLLSSGFVGASGTHA